MRRTKAIERLLPFTVLRDDREKRGKGWEFPPSEFCAGTVVAHLKTGDYTIAGLEHILCLERKGSVTEFVGNLIDKNFELELERMQSFPLAYVILEFSMTHLRTFPKSSGLSPYTQAKLPLRAPGAAFSRFTELILAHPHVNFLFTDFDGDDLAMKIFEKTIERCSRG